ncbi:MAG: hypothetical protein QOD92_3103 [Acidimicrobiaceae bacterium]|jgi:hypothetical protein
MSDFPPDRDELASAYLDGESTAEERALVEDDPGLLARVTEFRAVREALAAPVTPPATGQRETAITAAVGASTVVALDRARARRGLRIASIAAAVLFVLGAVGILIRAAGSQSEDKFQTVAGAIGSGAGVAATAERAPQASATAGGASNFSVGGQALGSFADRASLVAATQSQVHSPTFDQRKQATTPPGAASAADGSAPTTVAPSCLVPAPPDTVKELYAATAVLEDRPVQIDVFTIADGSLVLVVTDATSCTQVFSQPV